MTVKPLGPSRHEIDDAVAREVTTLIPEISKIRNSRLRDAVVLTWACSWQDSHYTSLRDVMQGVGAMTLLRHVTDVNDQVDHVIGVAESTYGLALDHDVARAGAILHDVDKPLLWTADDQGWVTFRPGRSLRDHGVLGAELAALCGVPAAVCSIVRGHSPYSDLMAERRSPEAVVVYHCDGLAGDLGALSVGIDPACGRTKLVPPPF